MTIFNLLIIDDNDIDRYIIKEYLEMAEDHYNISEAIDGEEGLSYLRDMSQFPDIILLDINMPRLGGFEFLEHYTQYYSDKKTSIFMLSSSEMHHEQERAKSFSMVKAFLVKPFNMENIAKIISFTKESHPLHGL